MSEAADQLIVLDVGAAAHGGYCVARHEGRVVFVRHALPGERVRAAVTEERGSFWRADAVEVLAAAQGRVTPPCPHAGPGRCGGCDWQHADAATQRDLKAAVVREQFARLAGLDVSGLLTAVEPLPPEQGLLGWRTRITYALDRSGRPGLHRHRSGEIERLAACPLGAPGVGDSPALARTWPGLTGIEVARGDDGAVTLIGHRPGAGRQSRGRRPPDRTEVIDGPDVLPHRLGERTFEVAAAGFWQVHPAAAASFAAAVLQAVRPAPGETCLDLYAGAGALTATLADAVGPSGRVIGVESSARAVADATANLAETPWAQVRRGRVDAALLAALGERPDVIVLDPPRAGAGHDVMAALLALAPRAVAYVACDPAALARDVAAAGDLGWRLSGLRAFDAFPMTHHVECVAQLEPGGQLEPGDGSVVRADAARPSP
ncbi:methyltransferase [Jatrophihabitans cynanchi]|uniref:Methyltransferase n=1 Tax=Jatrophihabitans cynanchi TaxID=2944128 RepID=A0ABY7K189_9ACTN|nr:TRAM domain-containing protein [Jatrophihabitans sp. SB3-54]WAX57367.1 methyltransferase [Jatrophihabitans sp. SB3-54]